MRRFSSCFGGRRHSTAAGQQPVASAPVHVQPAQTPTEPQAPTEAKLRTLLAYVAFMQTQAEHGPAPVPAVPDRAARLDEPTGPRAAQPRVVAGSMGAGVAAAAGGLRAPAPMRCGEVMAPQHGGIPVHQLFKWPELLEKLRAPDTCVVYRHRLEASVDADRLRVYDKFTTELAVFELSPRNENVTAVWAMPGLTAALVATLEQEGVLHAGALQNLQVCGGASLPAGVSGAADWRASAPVVISRNDEHVLLQTRQNLVTATAKYIRLGTFKHATWEYERYDTLVIDAPQFARLREALIRDTGRPCGNTPAEIARALQGVLPRYWGLEAVQRWLDEHFIPAYPDVEEL